MTYDFQCVILTHGEKGTPHLEELRSTNLGLEVEVWKSKDVGKLECDANIYHWSVENKATQRILFLEYDTRVSGDLNKYYPDTGLDLEAAAYFPDNFVGPLASSLPAEMQSSACLVAPLSGVMLSARALDYLSKSGAYSQHCFGELRIATVLKHGGFSIAQNDRLTHIKCFKKLLPDQESDFIHPYK